MRRTPPNIEEAIESAETVVEFLEGLRDLLGSKTRSVPSPQLPLAMALPAESDDMTWKDKVILILKAAARPLRPLEISQEYSRRGWTAQRGKQSHMIRATLAYLKRTKMVNHDATNGTYSLV